MEGVGWTQTRSPCNAALTGLYPEYLLLPQWWWGHACPSASHPTLSLSFWPDSAGYWLSLSPATIMALLTCSPTREQPGNPWGPFQPALENGLPEVWHLLDFFFFALVVCVFQIYSILGAYICIRNEFLYNQTWGLIKMWLIEKLPRSSFFFMSEKHVSQPQHENGQLTWVAWSL